MAHYGLLGNYNLVETAEDIRGTTLYGAQNEKLGKIDDVIFDHSTGDIQYAVVDTGGWLKSKKFLVPASRLRSSTEHERDFTSDLTKQQIETFPAYDDRDLESQDKWADYESRYRSKWESDPVMHREGTDRNITPTTQQLEGNQSSMQAAGESSFRTSTSLDRGVGRNIVEGKIEQEEDVIAASSPTERIVPAGSDAVIISSNASGIGPRWDTFQDRLRERRKEAVSTCVSCDVNRTSPRTSNNVDTLRKAG